MSTIEERKAYLDNPFRYLTKPIYGDFSTFYVTIGICTAIGITLIILNFIFGCCSKYRHYWQDRHTGNRWLFTIWTDTPHKQPPLDLTELKDVKSFQPISGEVEQHHEYIPPTYQKSQRQFDPRTFHFPHHHQQQQQQHHREEFVELQKRESDI